MNECARRIGRWKELAGGLVVGLQVDLTIRKVGWGVGWSGERAVISGLIYFRFGFLVRQ